LELDVLMLSALLCGFIFGWGLLISGLVQPAKVLGFLDVFGTWDPSLAVVVAAALAVSSLGFALATRRERPIVASLAQWPAKTKLDGQLVTGAVLFGLGWGLVGLCPGPALENLVTLSPGVVLFVAAMAAGMLLHDLWQKRPAPGVAARTLSADADG
jgi:uncharacterized membrane protein YedE/YeeE